MNTKLGLVVYPKLMSYGMRCTSSNARNLDTSSLEEIMSNKVARFSFFIRQLSRLDADGCIRAGSSLLAQSTWINADDGIDDLRIIVSRITNTNSWKRTHFGERAQDTWQN